MTDHALKRARERGIAFPDHVYAALESGRMERFGKHGVKFISKSIICVGEDKGHEIVIKTIEVNHEML